MKDEFKNAVQTLIDNSGSYVYETNNYYDVKDHEEACEIVEKAIRILEILKPLCQVVETPAKSIRYLKIRGVVVYDFKDIEQFNLFKEWLNDE